MKRSTEAFTRRKIVVQNKKKFDKNPLPTDISKGFEEYFTKNTSKKANFTKAFAIRHICILALTLTVIQGKSQTSPYRPSFQASLSSYVSSGDDLPFWVTSNKNGVFTAPNSTYQLVSIGASRELEQDAGKSWGVTYGLNMVYGNASRSDFHINEAWAGIRFKWLVLRGGMQAEPTRYGGLSSTNGNMVLSSNARPMPRIELASNGYIPFFFWEKWFSLKFEYEENFLIDERHVKNAKLHHKNLYLRAYLGNNWQAIAGADLWTYWGGDSPEYGKLPGIEDYFRYILGRGGSSNAPETDQLNVAGNSLGTYVFKISKTYGSKALTFYYNHFFEDRSGMEFVNWADGLWGTHLKWEKQSLVNEIVCEFMHTKHQSGEYHLHPEYGGRGLDDYFNHSVYKSGHTYYSRMLGSPLFIPAINEDGISVGFKNNRIWMLHTGAKGYLNRDLRWESLFTFSKNFGTYIDPHKNPLDQISLYAKCSYIGEKLPFALHLGVAGDYGSNLETRTGVFAGINFDF